MKKNIRDYKANGNQFAYVLNSINVTDYDGNEIDATDRERVKYFLKCFEIEYNYEYNKKRYPNIQERISEYLKGLPSCIGIEFENYKIAEIGKSWGYCKNERKESESFIPNIFGFVYISVLFAARNTPTWKKLTK